MQGQKFYVAGYNTRIANTLQHVYEYSISINCWDQLPIYSPGQFFGVPHIIGDKLCVRLVDTGMQQITNQLQVVTFDSVNSHTPGYIIIPTCYSQQVDRASVVTHNWNM